MMRYTGRKLKLDESRGKPILAEMKEILASL